MTDLELFFNKVIDWRFFNFLIDCSIMYGDNFTATIKEGKFIPFTISVRIPGINNDDVIYEYKQGFSYSDITSEFRKLHSGLLNKYRISGIVYNISSAAIINNKYVHHIEHLNKFMEIIKNKCNKIKIKYNSYIEAIPKQRI